MAGKAATANKVAEEVDLLADIQNEDQTSNVQDPDEEFDLLSEMNESDAEAWVPFDDESVPDGIQGTVTHIGTVTQEAKYGGNDVPYIEIRDKTGKMWGIRGYATVLANQLNREIDAGLKNGDLLAVVYKGIKENRSKTNEYKDFTVRSKRM